VLFVILFASVGEAQEPESPPPAFVRCRATQELLSWADLGVPPVAVPKAEVRPQQPFERVPGSVWVLQGPPRADTDTYVAIDRDLPLDEVLTLLGTGDSVHYELVEATGGPTAWPSPPGADGGDPIRGWVDVLENCPSASPLLATDGSCPSPSLGHAWREAAADPECGLDEATAVSMAHSLPDTSRGPLLAFRPLRRATGSQYLPPETPWAQVDTAMGWPERRLELPSDVVRLRRDQVTHKKMTSPVSPPIPDGSTYRCTATVLIDTRGHVTGLFEVRGCPSSYRSIIEEAVLQWAFYPPEVDGKKVDAVVDFKFLFD